MSGRTIPSARDQMLAMFVAQGSAIAGEPLTRETLFERLRDPEFRARFNGPAPTVVRYPDAATARLAAGFEEGGSQ